MPPAIQHGSELDFVHIFEEEHGVLLLRGMRAVARPPACPGRSHSMRHSHFSHAEPFCCLFAAPNTTAGHAVAGHENANARPIPWGVHASWVRASLLNAAFLGRVR